MKNTNVLISFFILAMSATVLGSVDLNDVINLGKWSKSDLLELVNQENYSYHQSLLREKLSESIMQHGVSSLPLDIQDAKVLAGFTASYTLIYLNSAHEITLAPKVNGKQAKRSLKAAAGQNVEQAIATIGLSNYSGGGLFLEYSKRFSTLFALAYMAQPSFCEYFTRLYQEIMNTSATAETFLSTEQFFQLIEQEMGSGSDAENL